METKTLGILIAVYVICIVVAAIGLAYIAIHFIAKFW